MTSQATKLAIYLDMYRVLQGLLTEVRSLLKDRFLGLFLGGSLAIGDFDPQYSDIDFLVVTSCDLSEEALLALHDLHSRMVAGGSKWGRELEGSYIPLRAVRRHDPADAMHPHIERGGELRVEGHDSDWVIQRHIVREYGLVMAGPEPKSLIEPVTPDDLRTAVRGLLWW